MVNNQIHPRVLVIDDDDRVREDLHAIFEPLGYDVKVAVGSNNALLDNAKSLARQFRPHVAIVDLRLLLNDDPTDRSGFKLLNELNPTRCILYSAYINPETSRQLSDLKAAGWIGKEEPPQMLVDMVHKIAKESSAAQKNFIIENNSISLDQVSHALLGKDTEAPIYLIEDILCQTFHNAPGIIIESITGAARTSSSFSRGRSVILKIKRTDKIESFVVKMAKKEDILREYDSYKKYVEGNLRGNFYAILRGKPQIFWDLGCLVYGFLGAGEQNTPTYTQHYQEQDTPEALVKPLRSFFSEVWASLYHNVEESQQSIFEVYEHRLIMPPKTEDIKVSDTITIPGLPISLPNPISFILNHKEESKIAGVQQAITHGDLCGDNLLTERGHIWVIDFDRSGWGYILRDFIELEVDILTRLTSFSEEDFKVFFELIVMLMTPHSPISMNPLGITAKIPASIFENLGAMKALTTVAELRNLACDIVQIHDVRAYYWGILLVSLSVTMQTPKNDSRHNQAMLIAAIVADRLQHIQDEWKLGDIVWMSWRERSSQLLQRRMEEAEVKYRNNRSKELRNEIIKVGFELELRKMWAVDQI